MAKLLRQTIRVGYRFVVDMDRSKNPRMPAVRDPAHFLSGAELTERTGSLVARPARAETIRNIAKVNAADSLQEH